MEIQISKNKITLSGHAESVQECAAYSTVMDILEMGLRQGYKVRVEVVSDDGLKVIKWNPDERLEPFINTIVWALRALQCEKADT